MTMTMTMVVIMVVVVVVVVVDHGLILPDRTADEKRARMLAKLPWAVACDRSAMTLDRRRGQRANVFYTTQDGEGFSCSVI